MNASLIKTYSETSVFQLFSEETYITLVPYEPQFEDEVKLEMGVIVEVAQKNLNGWWFVR